MLCEDFGLAGLCNSGHAECRFVRGSGCHGIYLPPAARNNRAFEISIGSVTSGLRNATGGQLVDIDSLEAQNRGNVHLIEFRPGNHIGGFLFPGFLRAAVEDISITKDDGDTMFRHSTVAQQLKTYFRADPGGIAHCYGDFGMAHALR